MKKKKKLKHGEDKEAKKVRQKKKRPMTPRTNQVRLMTAEYHLEKKRYELIRSQMRAALSPKGFCY